MLEGNPVSRLDSARIYPLARHIERTSADNVRLCSNFESSVARDDNSLISKRMVKLSYAAIPPEPHREPRTYKRVSKKRARRTITAAS